MKKYAFPALALILQLLVGTAESHAAPDRMCDRSCVCVTAEGCPCCLPGWPFASDSRPKDENAVLASIAQSIAKMDSSAAARARATIERSVVPESRADRMIYYTMLAFLYLPSKQANAIGIRAGQTDPHGDSVKISLGFEYIAYAACFYGGVLGGGDVVDVGDDCKEEWVD